MKAIVQTCVSSSKNAVYTCFSLISNLPIPVPKCHEVLVRVVAASLSPIDFKMGHGYALSALGKHPPFIIGRDFSGCVVQVGNSVLGFEKGDEVWGACHPLWHSQGTLSEYIVVSANSIAIKPKVLSHSSAAVIPYALCTSWAALGDTPWFGGIGWSGYSQQQKRILVLGGNGYVGSFCIQLARQVFRASCIAATVGKTENAVDDCESKLGADVAISSYNNMQWASDLLVKLKNKYQHNNNNSFDLIVNASGNHQVETDARSLLPRGANEEGGRIVSLDGNYFADNDGSQAGKLSGLSKGVSNYFKSSLSLLYSHNASLTYGLVSISGKRLQMASNMINNNLLYLDHLPTTVYSSDDWDLVVSKNPSINERIVISF